MRLLPVPILHCLLFTFFLFYFSASSFFASFSPFVFSCSHWFSFAYFIHLFYSLFSIPFLHSLLRSFLIFFHLPFLRSLFAIPYFHLFSSPLLVTSLLLQSTNSLLPLFPSLSLIAVLPFIVSSASSFLLFGVLSPPSSSLHPPFPHILPRSSPSCYSSSFLCTAFPLQSSFPLLFCSIPPFFSFTLLFSLAFTLFSPFFPRPSFSLPFSFPQLCPLILPSQCPSFPLLFSLTSTFLSSSSFFLSLLHYVT